MSVTPERQRLARVLIVEDDARQRQTLTDILEDEGFHVASCATGGEALNRLRHEDFGVAIVDLRLPDIGESELLDQLRDLAPRVHVILHTGYGSLASAKSAVNIGAFAYVEKDGDPGELVAHVHRAFRTHIDRYADNLEAAVAERTAELTAANRLLQSEIIERKWAEQALGEAEQRYRLLFERNLAGVYQTALDGTILDCNESMAIIFGYASRQELLSCRAPDLYFEGTDRAEFITRLKENGSLRNSALRMRRKDGAPVDTLEHVILLYDDQGTPSVIQGTLIDITERKRAEEASKVYLAAIENALDGIVLTDMAGEVLYCNESSCEIFGYSAAEMRDLHVSDFSATAEAARCLEEELAREGKFYNEIEGKRNSGERFHALLTVSIVENAKGEPIGRMGVFRDITERKRREEELARLNEELLKVSRDAGRAEVASSVLHNVGNVLTTVSVSTELIAEMLHKSKVSGLSKAMDLMRDHAEDLATFLTADEKGRHLTTYLTELAKHLVKEQTAMLGEVRLLSRGIEHIKRVVRMQRANAHLSGMSEPVVVPELLEDVLKLKAGALERQRIQLTRDYAKMPSVVLDRHKLLQIVLNLVTNALHALEASGVEDKRLTVRTTVRGDDHVEITIGDNGVGIPKDHLTKVFSYGFTTKSEGTGIGLHISALAAEEMHGSLTAHSDGPGQGATFTIEFPVKPAEVAQ